MAFGTLSVKGRALRWLAQREHSRLELERKLARVVEDVPGASAREQIASALDALCAAGLISEERVAESVLTSQARRFGVRRLKQTLQSKGLDPALVASTVEQARGTEFERARDLCQRRFGEAATDPAARAKQMRFLAGRGFSGEVVSRVLKSAAGRAPAGAPDPDDAG